MNFVVYKLFIVLFKILLNLKNINTFLARFLDDFMIWIYFGHTAHPICLYVCEI